MLKKLISVTVLLGLAPVVLAQGYVRPGVMIAPLVVEDREVPARTWIAQSLVDGMSLQLGREGSAVIVAAPTEFTPSTDAQPAVAAAREGMADLVLLGTCNLNQSAVIVNMSLHDVGTGKRISSVQETGWVADLDTLRQSLLGWVRPSLGAGNQSVVVVPQAEPVYETVYVPEVDPSYSYQPYAASYVPAYTFDYGVAYPAPYYYSAPLFSVWLGYVDDGYWPYYYGFGRWDHHNDNNHHGDGDHDGDHNGGQQGRGGRGGGQGGRGDAGGDQAGRSGRGGGQGGRGDLGGGQQGNQNRGGNVARDPRVGGPPISRTAVASTNTPRPAPTDSQPKASLRDTLARPTGPATASPAPKAAESGRGATSGKLASGKVADMPQLKPAGPQPKNQAPSAAPSQPKATLSAPKSGVSQPRTQAPAAAPSQPKSTLSAPKSTPAPRASSDSGSSRSSGLSSPSVASAPRSSPSLSAPRQSMGGGGGGAIRSSSGGGGGGSGGGGGGGSRGGGGGGSGGRR
jgi:TolB-like protein